MLSGLRVQMLLDNSCNPDPRVQREAAALHEAGASVRILCWDREGTAPATEERDGVGVERIVTRAGRQLGARQLPNLWRFYRRAWTSLRGRSIDVVHAHDLLMLPLGVLIARRAKASLVYDAHEIYHIMESHRYPTWLRYIIATAEKWLIRAFVDALVTVSEQRVDDYWRAVAPTVPTTVVANWYDPAERNTALGAQTRAQYAIPPDALCVAYIGGFTGERRMDLLISAARERPEVYYLVAGRGIPSIEEQLLSATRELPNFRYIGWSANPQPLLSAADVLFYILEPTHPYSRFAASNTLYTAIANRLPLITCDVGEPGYVIRRIEPALALRSASAEALIQAIDWLRDATARAEVARSMEWWRSRYTWSASKGNLREAYTRLTARANARTSAQVSPPAAAARSN